MTENPQIIRLLSRVTAPKLHCVCYVNLRMDLLKGAYPSDVLTALRQLETENHIHLSPAGLWICPEKPDTTTKATSHLGRATNEFPDGLPEPHPLDFDWRFTQATVADLRTRINAAPSESVAILGAPTLFKYLIDSGVNAWLFDKNPHVVQHLKAEGYPSVVECDLLQFSAGSTRFQWAVADPPWYIEHYQAFLDAGRKILVPEGKIFLSVLPRLTRPSAPADRFHILECAMNLGFDLIEVNPTALHYVSPPFEIEALRAEGLAIGDWRTGDLFSFVMRSQKPQRSRPTTPNGDEQWQPVQLGKTTIKIKLEPWIEGEPFSYEPVSPSGSVRLRSVSRRSPVRSRINVWTSRNVALRVSRPRVLAEALEKIAKGESTATAVASLFYEYHFSQAETEKLREILQLLIQDAGLTWND